MSRRFATGLTAAVVLASSLAVAAPALAGGGGAHCDASSSQGNTVKMDGTCYLPSVTYAKPGTVRFINGPAMAHTVTGLGRRWHAELQPGQEATIRFDRPGVYPYLCELHFGMIGAVVIGSAGGLGVRDVESQPPAPVEETVEEVAEPVEDAVDDATDLDAAPASGRSGEAATPVVAIAAAGMGLAAGIVLRRRPRDGRDRPEGTPAG